MNEEPQVYGIIGICKAADLLGVKYPTVSLYVKKHRLNRALRGKRQKVDFEELVRHMDEHRNPSNVLQEDQARLRRQADGSDFSHLAGRPQREQRAMEHDRVSNVATYAEARAEREKVKLKSEELALRQKMEEIVPVHEVEEATVLAIQMLRNHVSNRRRDMAEKLIGVNDLDEMVKILEEFDKKMMEDFSNGAGMIAASDKRDDAAA